MTGVLAVLAVRLLQIRRLSDEDSDRPAKTIVPAAWIEVLAQVRKRNAETMIINEFVRHLGGHLGRKRDGRPGWITLWRGLEKLLLILRGTQLKT